MPESKPRLLTISEAAALLGVHPNTLRAWVDKGLVPATHLPSGHRRFSQDQLAQIQQVMRADMPQSPRAHARDPRHE